MRHGTADRRRMPRLARPDQHGIVTTRVRPGHDARIVDVSAGGALIDTEFRLLPGASVELHVQTDKRHTRVRGQVLRCSVVRLRANGVSYRGAIRFEHHLPWFGDEPGAPINGANARPSHPTCGAPTPEVI
jgi:PilZ domain